jgi:hypothetical protein
MKFIEPLTIDDTAAFSRASIASHYTRLGGLAFAPVNEPRLNYPREYRSYAPSGWLAGPSLLLPTAPLPGVAITPAAAPEFLAEPAATNLMVQSQDLTGWTATEVTIAANNSVAPDGTATADKILPSAVDTADHRISRAASAAVAAGATVGCSIFLRAAGAAFAVLRCAPAGEAEGFEMTVDLANADIPVAGGFGAGSTLVDARLITLSAGWFRLELEGSVAGVTDYQVFLWVGDGVATFAGDGLAGIEAWGAQIEVGGCSSYIATTAAAVTRAADVGTPLLVSSVPEDEPVYNAATTYAKDAIARGTGVDAHKVFLSIQAGNVGKALTDKAWWIEAGLTNRWRMFDDGVGSQTAAPNAITTVLNPQGRVNAAALMQIEAASVRVTMTDQVDGVVFDETISLVDNSGINTPWQWFFEPIRRKTYQVIEGLPPYAGAQLSVTLMDEGFSPRAGALVVGVFHYLGRTQWNPELSIIDASIKQRDVFNNVTLQERAYSRRGNFALWVEPGFVDRFYDLMAQYRAKLLVWVASEQYASMVIFGFYRDFRIAVPYPTLSLGNLQLEAA